MSFTTEILSGVAAESWSEWIHDHWIPFRRSKRLSFQAMSSNCTQNQLCRATIISSPASELTCHFGLCLILSGTTLRWSPSDSVQLVFVHIRCKNWKGAKFSIQVIEKLKWDSYKNGVMDEDMLEDQTQREDY